MRVRDLKKSKKISAGFPEFIGNIRISVNCFTRFLRSDMSLDFVCQRLRSDDNSAIRKSKESDGTKILAREFTKCRDKLKTTEKFNDTATERLNFEGKEIHQGLNNQSTLL